MKRKNSGLPSDSDPRVARLRAKREQALAANKMRANRASGLLLNYALQHMSATDYDESIELAIDVLSDLWHLAKQNGWSYQRLIELSRGNFSAELKGE